MDGMSLICGYTLKVKMMILIQNPVQRGLIKEEFVLVSTYRYVHALIIVGDITIFKIDDIIFINIMKIYILTMGRFY